MFCSDDLTLWLLSHYGWVTWGCPCWKRYLHLQYSHLKKRFRLQGGHEVPLCHGCSNQSKHGQRLLPRLDGRPWEPEHHSRCPMGKLKVPSGNGVEGAEWGAPVLCGQDEGRQSIQETSLSIISCMNILDQDHTFIRGLRGTWGLFRSSPGRHYTPCLHQGCKHPCCLRVFRGACTPVWLSMRPWIFRQVWIHGPKTSAGNWEPCAPGTVNFLQLYADSPHVHIRSPLRHPVSDAIVAAGLSHPQFENTLAT